MAVSILYDAYRTVNSAMRIVSSAHQLWRIISSSSNPQILQIFLSGVIALKDITSETVLLSQLRDERDHREELQECQEILMIVNAPAPLMYRIEPLWFHNDSSQRSRAWRGIDRVVQHYRSTNRQFEKLQWVGLVLHILKSIQQGNTAKRELVLLLINEGHKVLKFHARARCDSSLTISGWAKCLLYPYEAFQFVLAVATIYRAVKNRLPTPQLPPFSKRELEKN